MTLKIIAKAKLPSRFGTFDVYAFSPPTDNKEHTAITTGDLTASEPMPVRIHSECLTGDSLGSLRCDCGEQLQRALRKIGKKRRGVILYLRQEGRGIGLVNKIRAYELQDTKGIDTYDANVALGFAPDERDFSIAAEMLKALGIKSVVLLTNNPEKIKGLEKNGIKVLRRAPHQVSATRHNKRYLLTKKQKFGHLLP
jgi:GTP cyclohydrolase II